MSLLSTVSKVFERIIYNEIYDFCLKNNILTYKNSGIKKRDSTINQLIHLTHLIHKVLDDEKQIAMVFLDISKAFDKVWHDGLLFKLDSIGIKGKLLKLIKSYLGNRKQRVVLNGSVSEFLQYLIKSSSRINIGTSFFLNFSK